VFISLLCVLLGANVNIGLRLFAEKYASHEDRGLGAFGIVFLYIIISNVTDFLLYIYNKIASKYKKDWVTPATKEIKGDRKTPSRVSIFAVCLLIFQPFCLHRITTFAGLSGLQC